MAEEKSGFFWRLLTVANSVKDVLDVLGKTHSSLPEELKQKLPGFLGLSLADEQIFNGVRGQLTSRRQKILGEFLYEKCKDYERNRFINIVAGMEVVPGKPGEKETKWNEKTGVMTSEKIKDGTPGIDYRKVFLESFADAILSPDHFNGDLQKAYEDCVGGRMIISDPLHQKALRSFSESVGQFKKFVLTPFKSGSVEELVKKIRRGTSNSAKRVLAKADNVLTRAETAVQSRKDSPLWKKLLLN